MDIQQLKYVVYAVRLESHTRAAEALYVQPQTISKAVSNTETRCGRKLFVREGRNVRATDFGRQYADLAEQVTRAYAALENLEQPPANLALLADTLSLAVATTAYRGDICPPDAIPAFLERAPHVQINLLRYPNDTCLRAVKNDLADGAVVLGPYESSGYESKQIGAVTPVVLLHHMHPLAGKQHLTLQDLAPYTLAYPEDIRFVYPELEKHFCSFGLPLPNLVQIAPHAQELLAFLAEDGLVLSYANNKLAVSRDDLCIIPLAPEHQISFPICLVTKQATNNETLRCLGGFLAEYDAL